MTVKGNAQLKAWLGDDSVYLADSEVIAFSCRHKGEAMAALVLFRDADQPFDPGLPETCNAIAPVFAETWPASCHHRHLPFGPSGVKPRALW